MQFALLCFAPILFFMQSAMCGLPDQTESDMTTQTTYTAQKLQDLKDIGARYLVVMRADFGGRSRGECVSWHKSYDKACAKATSWHTVQDINDAIGAANE